MKIAVLSGKGGTGKTFVSVNLACVAEPSVYLDCDVEEPNGHLFFKPDVLSKDAVSVMVPELDREKCNGCRKCVDFCRYNALALIKEKPMIFYEICHSCGGCVLFCPQKALTEKQREIGVVEHGVSGEVSVFTGCLNTGEVSGVPIIKKLMQAIPTEGVTVIDCPPGSACMTMESIRQADFCVLVAEPTLFGVHNLAMVYELVQLFHKPFGVVLNKCLDGENPSEKFCVEKEIPILAKIPFEEELGSLNASGQIAVRVSERYKEVFCGLYDRLRKEADV